VRIQANARNPIRLATGDLADQRVGAAELAPRKARVVGPGPLDVLELKRDNPLRAEEQESDLSGSGWIEPADLAVDEHRRPPVVTFDRAAVGNRPANDDVLVPLGRADIAPRIHPAYVRVERALHAVGIVREV